MMDLHIQMGLKDQGSLGEPLHEIMGGPDLDRMRKAITFGQRDSGLISMCFRTAEANGLNGEETMTLIAYHALCQLEEFWRRQVTLTMLDPRAMMRPDNQGCSK